MYKGSLRARGALEQLKTEFSLVVPVECKAREVAGNETGKVTKGHCHLGIRDSYYKDPSVNR